MVKLTMMSAVQRAALESRRVCFKNIVLRLQSTDYRVQMLTECRVQSVNCAIVKSTGYKLILVVLILDARRAQISFRSVYKESNSDCVIISLSKNISNQYRVSSASFNAMFSLLMKSALLCAE